MGAELMGIGMMAVLFTAFYLLRPADRAEAGCGACAHATDECATGGGVCPMLRDL